MGPPVRQWDQAPTALSKSIRKNIPVPPLLEQPQLPAHRMSSCFHVWKCLGCYNETQKYQRGCFVMKKRSEKIKEKENILVDLEGLRWGRRYS